ncbi:MAG TPA: allantoinase AllB [Spirochaetia bacterium]|nr:allantoinase AllB [Spirochaetia bacterium]
MALDCVIRGATVVRSAGLEVVDIGVEDERIAVLAPEITQPSREALDAHGLHVFPGVLDAHVHFNDPGRESWEGVPTGSSALVAGGGTCFIDMPLNSSPPTLDADSFDKKLAACRGRAFADFALWGGLTPDNLDELEALAERGVVGFKAFMSASGIDDFRSCDDETLYKGMRIAASLGLPVAVHAENDGMTAALFSIARSAGRTSVRDYLGSRPIAAEAEAISRALAFAEDTGCALHIVHTSSARGVRLVRRAVQDGLCDASCETCPHYLLLSDLDVMRIGARAKCAPPIRPEAERRELVREVLAGNVDTIGSDHSPSPPEMKQDPDFFKVWGGISGAQATLRALLTLDLPLTLVADLVSGNVARRFRLLGKGGIRIGADADLAFVDLSRSSPVTEEELLDRHKLSPYVGRTLCGTVRRTMLRGRTVFLDGTVVGAPKGKHLRPDVTEK